MDTAGYWAAITAMGLIKERETEDGSAWICRDHSGEPVRITKPEELPESERGSVIEWYRFMYGSQTH